MGSSILIRKDAVGRTTARIAGQAIAAHAVILDFGGFREEVSIRVSKADRCSWAGFLPILQTWTQSAELTALLEQ